MTSLRPLLCLLLLTLTACGPVIGQSMRLSEGTSIESIISGRIEDLKPRSRLLVLGPFAKTHQAFYICRGEEATSFAEQMADKGFYRTDLSILPGFQDNSETFSRLKSQSALAIQNELGLAEAPEVVLFGTILRRSMNIAPTRGIIQDVAYRLEFYDLATGSSTIIDVKSKQNYQDCIPNVIDTLMAKVTGF